MTEVSENIDMTVDSIKAEEKAILAEARESLGNMGKELVSSRFSQQELMAQSAAEGGPGSVLEAILTLLDSCKIGIRELSRQTGVRRKLLVGMFDGRIPVSPEVISKIYDIAKVRNPDLFAFEKQPKA